MEKMDDRISFEKSDDFLHIEIKAVFDKAKQNLLLAWLLLWTAAGIFIFIELFLIKMTKNEMLFIFIWLAFWLYFEYKVVLAFRWHKYGKEIMEIDDENIILYKVIGKRGLPRNYPISEVSDFRMADSQKGFSLALSQSYWVVGGEVLTFTYEKSNLIFGMHLDPKAAKKLLDFVKHEFKFFKNKK